MTVWENLLIVSCGNLVFFFLQVLYFNYKRRDAVPKELHKEIQELRRDVVSLRGQVKYLEGRINGKMWKLEGG
jgi:cell division protein FtsB